MVMKISAVEAGVPLLSAVGPRCVVKQATVKRCVAALLLVSVASIFYYTHYIISSPLSRLVKQGEPTALHEIDKGDRVTFENRSGREAS